MSWTDMGFPTISDYDQNYPSIGIYSNDKLHVVWAGGDSNNTSYSQIKYSNNISGTWSSWINIQPSASDYQYNQSIAIDSNDKLHVIWTTLASYKLYYTNNILGSWSSATQILATTNYSPIVIDNNNKLHITHDNIRYSNSDNWNSYITIFNATCSNISMIIHNSKPYCAYFNSSLSDIYYTSCSATHLADTIDISLQGIINKAGITSNCNLQDINTALGSNGYSSLKQIIDNYI